MAIKFYRSRDLPYGCFSNFSRHSIWLDGLQWLTVEHYFQAQKHTFNPKRYMEINSALTPRIAADLGRERSSPIRPDWEEVKDDIMRKAVKKKFQIYEDIRKILLDTGDEDILEDSPVDYYWGIGQDGTGKNMLGKILVEVREFLKEFQHCLTCGTTHKINAPCPPGAFSLITCSCGNEDLIPHDVLCFGLKGMYCGQCSKDTDWKVKIPTVEDIKRHWKNYK